MQFKKVKLKRLPDVFVGGIFLAELLEAASGRMLPLRRSNPATENDAKFNLEISMKYLHSQLKTIETTADQLLSEGGDVIGKSGQEILWAVLCLFQFKAPDETFLEIYQATITWLKAQGIGIQDLTELVEFKYDVVLQWCFYLKFT